MTALLALFVGALVTAVLLVTTRTVLAQPTLQRQNHRGHELPTAAGLLLVAAAVAVEGGRTVVGMLGLGEADTASARLLILAAVVAFGFLGLVDDLLGDADDRGLRGHLRAAVRGRVTTGFLKLGGGVAVALVLAGAADGDRPGWVLVDGAVIALAANLGNLFDRAPGRTLKWALLCYLPLALVAGTAAAGMALAVVMGAAIGLLLADLREELMLGDTGANALGAALGTAVVLSTGEGVRLIVCVVALGLTLLSEVASFSRIIEAVPPLRAFDRLGRRPVGGER